MYDSQFTLFEKSNFCPKLQFWHNSNIFTSFSPKFFLAIFLVKSKLSTAKESKTATFSRVFHPKNRQFLREIKVEFLDKKWRFRIVWKINPNLFFIFFFLVLEEDCHFWCLWFYFAYLHLPQLFHQIFWLSLLPDGSLQQQPWVLPRSVTFTVSTVFENHRKSLIQHCERSELRLHFEWTKVN